MTSLYETTKLFCRVAVPFCLLLAMHKSSSCSTPLTICGIVSIFYFSHFNRHVHCGFNLYFLMANNVKHVPLCHPYVLYSDMSVFCLFLHRLIFILLNFKSSLCTLDTTSLSDVWFTNIFSVCNSFILNC